MAIFVGVVIIIIVTNLTLSGPGSSAASFPKSPVEAWRRRLLGIGKQQLLGCQAPAGGGGLRWRTFTTEEDFLSVLYWIAFADFFRIQKPNNLPRTKGGA